MMNVQDSSTEFSYSYFGRTYLVQMPPRLTALEAATFKQIWQVWLQAKPAPTRIILDFGRTTFIDSSGIGALFRNAKLAKQQQTEVVAWSIQPQLATIFSSNCLDKAITVEAKTQVLVCPQAISNHQRSSTTHPSVRSRIKRGVDIVGAVIGLGITSVLFIPITVAIQLDSPGPILFSQERCGWMGRRFRIWKFRSMVTNAEALKYQIKNEMEGALFKNENDPRVTRVGRFLRKTSLDELPQFWNVLKGEMSLVGTRPPTPDEVDAYEVSSWRRLDVKPGMTGEWQVNGRSQVRSFEEVMQLDLRYQKRQSIGYDFQLIFKTIFLIFQKGKGAY